MKADEPAYDVVTLMVAGEYDAADRIIETWIDSGNADLLCDSLASTLVDMIDSQAVEWNQYNIGAEMTPAKLWKLWLVQEAMTGLGPADDT